MKYLWNELLDSIRYNRHRFFLTGLGIAIGNIAVVIIIILSYSFSHSMLSQYYAEKTTIGLVISSAAGTTAEDLLKSGGMPDALESIRYLDGVRSWEKAEGEKTVRFAGDGDADMRSAVIDFCNVGVTEGVPFSEHAGNCVIMRSNQEFESSYHLGDSIYIDRKAYEIIGFTNENGTKGRPSLFFPEAAAGQINCEVSSAEGIYELHVTDGYQISDVREQVLSQLNQALHTKEAKFIDYSDESSRAMEETMKTVTVFLVLIAAVSLIVAAINVVNIMYITAL